MTGKLLKMPNMTPKEARGIMGSEIGTTFDYGQRLFAYFGSGDVFDYGEWASRDMTTMLGRDGQAAALEAALTLPIRQAKWAIEPGKGDKGEAEFVHSVMTSPPHQGGMEIPMQQIIGQVTGGQIYRKAFFETVWHQRPTDGKVAYKKVAYRPTATCELKRDAKTAAFDGFRQQVWLFGGVLKLSNQRVPGYVDIPKQRAYVYIHGKHREPLTGVSELDVCYWCYQTKMKLLFLWYNFLEQQSLPKVIVYGQDQPEANSRADDLASMRSSAVVGWEAPRNGAKAFEVLETGGKGGDQFKDALSFLETWQTSSVLAGFMGLSSLATLGRGSFALSQDQSDFFLMSRQAVTMEMQEDITHGLISPLVRYNFGTKASYPRFIFGPLVDTHMQLLTTAFQTMAVAPSLRVPDAILDLITERVASVMQLDVDQVHKIVMEAAKQRAAQAQALFAQQMGQQAAGQLGQLAGGVGAAAGIASQAAQFNAAAGQPPIPAMAAPPPQGGGSGPQYNGPQVKIPNPTYLAP